MRRAAFFDRDGTLNASPQAGSYILKLEQLIVLEPAVEYVKLFNAAGYLCIVLSNQQCVGKRMLSEDQLQAINLELMLQFKQRGAKLHDVLCCTHLVGVCICRKPGTGLALQAAVRWKLDLANSIMIGDSDADAGLAEALRIPFVRVQEGRVL